MSTQPASFYSTPAFELFRRGLTTVAIQQFRGINVWQTASSQVPNVALDCLNVIVSGSGGLEKFRLPQLLSPSPAAAPGPFPSGPQSFWDLQYLNNSVPTRQILANFQNSLYYYTWNA